MKKTQSDQGLKFDGAEVMSQNRSNKFRGNQHTGHSNDGRLVNKGRGPTVGNRGCDLEGPACPPTSALPSLPKQGTVRDSINRGTQHRGGGRSFEPSAGQNYKGNPDRINAGAGPRKGNSQ
jgi:hypothetical protein